MSVSPRRKKQIKKMTKDRVESQRKEKNIFLAETRSFVFSLIATGLQYGKASLAFLLCNVIVPSRSVFYAVQSAMVAPLWKLAEDSMSSALNSISKDSTITVDGAWDHRRNGKVCCVVFIDSKTDKIIHTEVVERSRGKLKGNFVGASTNMESEGVKRGIAKLKSNCNIKNYCHDKDNRTAKIFRDNWAELSEQLDPNHTKKSIERSFSKYNVKNALYGLKERLVWFFYALLRKTDDPAVREMQWKNCINHLSGDHSKCLPHKSTCYIWPKHDNIEARSLLSKFLENTQSLLAKVSPNCSTNSNEGYNASRVKFANKDTAWGISFVARVACSILQKNDPYQWIIMARKRLNLPDLPSKVVMKLNNLMNERLNRHNKQKLPQEKSKRRLYRRISRKICWVRKNV